MLKIQLSIQTKTYLLLAILMLIMLTIVIISSINSERDLGYNMVKERLHESASNYLDTMNILMLSGAMHNREMVRNKILANKNMLEARTLRSEQINKLYGPGLEVEKPVDKLDHRALKGEVIWLEKKTSKGHTLTHLMPIIAREDYHGTNCLGCHQAKDGDVLGAIRLTYSLNDINTEVRNNAMNLVGMQALLVIIIVLVFSFLLGHFIFKPIREIQKNLSRIEETSDLGLKMKVYAKDEVGKMSYALNHMLAKFSGSLSEVVTSTKKLDNYAHRLQTQSSESQSAAELQKKEVQAIEHTICELKSKLETVKSNAIDTTKASQETTRIASNSKQEVDSASTTIKNMNDAINNSADIVRRLAESSKGMAQVVVVINEIAEQTNLLALNAAIEAARAGDAGRGFAVVADEVRGLSQRTHSSTEEIAQMIKHLQEESSRCVSVMSSTSETAENGVEKINALAASLNDMQEHIEQITSLNNKTFEHIEEQNKLSEKVYKSVSEIAEQSNKTANSAQQTVKTSDKLNEVSQKLNKLVSQFKLKDTP